MTKITTEHPSSSWYYLLQKDRVKEVGGKLQSLDPFIDKEGILRVGGRLSNSPIPLQQKYPIILPKSSITELVIEYVYRTNHHSGTQPTFRHRSGLSTVVAKYGALSKGVSDVAEPIHHE